MMGKSLIVGLGKSGVAAYDLLEMDGDAVVGFDDSPAAVAMMQEAGKNATLTPVVKEFDRLILSPGVPPSHRVIVEAVKYGIPIIGEAELALQRLQVPAIGITGTNGKTTVTLLIEHALKKAGLSAHALGNVGAPLSAFAVRSKPDDIVVVELSSFQLDTLSAQVFDVGLILNITPDHLDRYASMEEYARSKCHLQNCLRSNGVLWVHESIVKGFKDLLKEGYKTFGQNEDCTLSTNEVEFLRNSELFLAPHDMQNVLAAWIACRAFNVAEDVFLEATRSFKKPSHRIEWVGSVDGIDYINDSKGTNIDATMKAVEAMNKPIVLIVGGVDKGASYEIWKASFASRVREIVALGEAAEKIVRDLQPDYQVPTVPTLSDAVLYAKSVAKEGDVVLLSPGCSSYDMFRDYAHRGSEFKRLVDLLKEKKG